MDREDCLSDLCVFACRGIFSHPRCQTLCTAVSDTGACFGDPLRSAVWRCLDVSVPSEYGLDTAVGAFVHPCECIRKGYGQSAAVGCCGAGDCSGRLYHWHGHDGRLLRCRGADGIGVLGGLSYTIELFDRSFEVTRQAFAVCALLPIWLYRGRQGPHGRMVRWLYYAFYPIHLLLLYLWMLLL